MSIIYKKLLFKVFVCFILQVRKIDSQTTSAVEQIRREAGVLSVTRSSPGILSVFFLQILL